MNTCSAVMIQINKHIYINHWVFLLSGKEEVENAVKEI